jgi:hypothetical protein
MRLRPADRIFHEGLHVLQPAFVVTAALLGCLQNVPPGGERVQGGLLLFFVFREIAEAAGEARARKFWLLLWPSIRVYRCTACSHEMRLTVWATVT